MSQTGLGGGARPDTSGGVPHRAADDDDAVLRRRALDLARVPEDDAAGETSTVVTFTVAGRRHSVEAGCVREVLRGVEVSRVPWAPVELAGVASVRGEIVTVADTAALLGAPTPARGGPVVVLHGPPPLGLLVDEVHDLVDLPAATLAAPPGDPVDPGRHLVLAIGPEVVVLDAAALLADPRFDTTADRSTDGKRP